MFLTPNNPYRRESVSRPRTCHRRNMSGISTTESQQLPIARRLRLDEIVLEFTPLVAAKAKIIRRMKEIIPFNEHLHAFDFGERL